MQKLVVTAALLLAPAASSAQRLRQVSRTVHEGRSTPRASNDNNPGGPSPSSASRGGPTRWRWNLSRWYLRYPYALGISSFEGSGVSAQDSRGTAGVLTVEGGLVLPNLGRGAIGVRAIFGAIEVELRASALMEPVAGGHDWAGLLGVRLGWAVTDGGPARVRALLGMLTYLDAVGDASGGETGFAVDAFPGRPWVLSAELTGGVLGRAGLLSTRGSVGLIVGHAEFFVAWTHQWLFPLVEGPAVDLGGPSLGLRTWM